VSNLRADSPAVGSRKIDSDKFGYPCVANAMAKQRFSRGASVRLGRDATSSDLRQCRVVHRRSLRKLFVEGAILASHVHPFNNACHGVRGLTWLAMGRSSETTSIGVRIHLNVKIENHIDLHYSMIEAQDMFRKYDSDGTYDTVVIVLGRADHSSTHL
jgi:hypothetical protein